MQSHGFGFYVVVFFAVIVLRYFLVAGISHLLFYRSEPAGATAIVAAEASLQLPPQLQPQAIGRRPSRHWIGHDIRLSVISAAIFALATAAMMTAYNHGFTLLYDGLDGHGLLYAALSYGAALILQDGYFYATHRLFHHPALFARLHQGHHRSPCPTPWTSFAFDPAEAAVQAVFLVAIVFVVPLHVVTLLAVLTTMSVWAVVNHLGLDRLPGSFPHHWLGRWVIVPQHHSLHHRKHRVHFGLYFTFWDNLCGTQDHFYSRELSPRPEPSGPVSPGTS